MAVSWPLPPDSQGHAFVHESSHFPGPVRTLDFELNVKAMESGFNAALITYDLPLRLIDLHINGFVYEALASVDQTETTRPRPSRPATSLPAVAIDELPRLWSDEWLPAIQDHLAFWQSFEPAAASTAQLEKHLEQTRERSLDLWAIHFRLFFPMLVAIRRFQELCAEIFPNRIADEVDLLLSGTQSKTTKGDDVLWRLGRELADDSELKTILDSTSVGTDWPTVRTSFADSSKGRGFLSRLEAYLHDFGRRGRDWSIDRPFLVEDPGSVVDILRTYADSDGSAPEARRAEQEARRVEVEAACVHRLDDLPHPLREAFKRLYRSARTATWLSEESYHWIEGLGSYSVRLVCLEVGRRLHAKGALPTAEDIFHLKPDEAARALSGTDPIATAKLAAARREDFSRSAALTPPPTLGTHGQSQAPTELGEALDLFFGTPVEPPSAELGHADLWGHGASSGKAQGPVRVLGSLDEAYKVRPGDVLVAHTTSPGWTPLFRSIAALVTETGGVLCHAAIVAREYNLPVAVGVRDAIRVLKDGQRVEVDGRAGTVRRLDPRPPHRA